MPRLWLFLLAGLGFLMARATHPELPPALSDPTPAFSWTEQGGETFLQASVNGRQWRFLPGRISIAEHRRLAPAPEARLQPEAEKAYEVMVWEIAWNHSGPAPVPQGRKPIIGHTTGDFFGTGGQGLRYEELWYEHLFPGIHLRYYFTAEGLLKYDILADPSSDLSQIRMNLNGAEVKEISAAGELVIASPWGEYLDDAPYSYQELGGYREEVTSRYQLYPDGSVGFAIEGSLIQGAALVIDPLTLTWTTFLHDTSSDDYAIAIARDADDYLYITGYSSTATFPVTPGVYQGTFGGSTDAFVAKLSPLGDQLMWCTYLGGSNWEMGYAIELDAAGNVYVAGYTASNDFPTTFDSYRAAPAGLVDGFVTCLDPTGQLMLYSTLIGGSNRDYLYDLEVSGSGEAIILGYTFSNDFPTTAGSIQPSYGGNGDVIVAKIAADGKSLLFSTYFGGTGFDTGMGMAIAPDGSIGIAGNGTSTNLPITVGALQTQLNQGANTFNDDGFFVRISHDASQILACTYLGGDMSDALHAVAVNASGDWFLGGSVYSTNLPVTPSAMQPLYLGSGDCYLARIDPLAQTLIYGSYLGGSDVDYLRSLAVDESDEVYALGATRSHDFPVSGNSLPHTGQYDVFLTQVDPGATAISGSILLGGSYNDYPRAAGSIDYSNGKIALGLTTHSLNGPQAGASYQSIKQNGLADAPWIVGLEADIVLPNLWDQVAATWQEEEQALVLEGWLLRDPGIERVELWQQQELDWQRVGTLVNWSSQEVWARDPHPAGEAGEALIYEFRLRTEAGDWYRSPRIAVMLPEPSPQWLVHLGPDGWQWDYQGPRGLHANLSLWDLTGRLLWKETVETGSGPQRGPVPTAMLPRGHYVLRIVQDGGRMKSARIVVQ